MALTMDALMLWVCQRPWVVDDAESHGISELQSSRPGAVAVFLGAINFSVIAEWAAVSTNVSRRAFFNHEPLAVLLPDILVLD